MSLMQTLYRKYRSQNFDEVFGQDAVVKVIREQVKKDQVGHAYLFTGPRGTGKTSMARLLAKAVNCTKSKDGNPCKKCSSCLAIEKGKFLDLIEIDAASNRGIDEIRRLKERVGFSPSEGKYKVYIIDEVHMMTKDAFNALLKTIEEPPAHVIFILATTEVHKIPQTILSRCQRFNFSFADETTILSKLSYICKQEKISFTNEALMAIVKNAGGSFRDAESILEKVLGGIGVVSDKQVDFVDVKDILGLAEDRQVQIFVENLLNKELPGSLESFSSLAESGVNLFQLIRQTLEHLRALLLREVSDKKGQYSLRELVFIISELSSAEAKLKYTSVARLPIEVAIVNICDVAKHENVNMPKAMANVKGEKVKRNVEEKSLLKAQSLPQKIMDIPKKITKSVKKQSVNPEALENIAKNWEMLIEKIRPFNHHLSAFFKKAIPTKVEGEHLYLKVPYRFHKQRIESMKAQEVFSQALEEVIGLPLRCVCEVTQEMNEEVNDLETNSKASNNVVLEVLGDMIE